jgi:hypothetical protein
LCSATGDPSPGLLDTGTGSILSTGCAMLFGQTAKEKRAIRFIGTHLRRFFPDLRSVRRR